MKINKNGEEITCTKAVRGNDYITIYDGTKIISECKDISDFSGYSVEGGVWSSPQPTELEIAQLKIKQLDSALEELILNVLPELLP